MNEHKEHIKQYSAADIQKYLEGQLPAAEMHAMEMAALDDPFLADAMEGISQQEPATVASDINDLQQRIRERTGNNKKGSPVIAFRWWQAAAAAIVLITGSIWIYNSMNNPKARSNLVSKNETKNESSNKITEPETATVPLADSVMVDDKKDYADISGNALKKEQRNITREEYKILRDITASERAANTDTIRQGRALKADDRAAEKPIYSPPASTARTLEEVVIKAPEKDSTDIAGKNQSKSKEEIAGKIKGETDKSNLGNFINGQVTDNKNAPLPNAFIQVENYKQNFVTDKYGYFKIPANDSVVDVSVAVTGFASQRFRLANNKVNVNQLRLQPAENAALSEVVVTTDKSTAKRSNNRTSNPTVMVQDALPVNGWMAYEKYIEENKRKPDNNLQLNGDVVVSFQVNRNGVLSGFKIEQSLAKGYDDEAIRLIKEGPAWKLQKGRKARVTIIVRF